MHCKMTATTTKINILKKQKNNKWNLNILCFHLEAKHKFAIKRITVLIIVNLNLVICRIDPNLIKRQWNQTAACQANVRRMSCENVNFVRFSPRQPVTASIYHVHRDGFHREHWANEGRDASIIADIPGHIHSILLGTHVIFCSSVLPSCKNG